MGEDDESFATVPALLHGGPDHPCSKDPFAVLLVARLGKAIEPFNRKLIDAMLAVLLSMHLTLPGNAAALESISRTQIIDYLVKILCCINLKDKNHQGIKVGALLLIKELVFHGYSNNIAACYRYGVIPILVDGIATAKVEFGSRSLECEILKLLKIQDDESRDDFLLDYSCIPTILYAMRLQPKRQDLQEWGCSGLRHILQGWDSNLPSQVIQPMDSSITKKRDKATHDDVGRAFLEFGAIDSLKNALKNNPSPAIIEEASHCIRLLAEQSPGIRSNLIEKGL
jgi:hypothetical protein